MKLVLAVLAVGMAFGVLGARGGAATTQAYDGRIAFATAGGIASMNTDGSGQWLVDGVDGDTQPAWSPDGSELAVTRPSSGLYVMQPDGSDRRLLVGSGSGYENPAWSPDGTRIAFDYGLSVSILQADGSSVQDVFLTRNGGQVTHPTWSPDGRKLAFSASDLSSDGTPRIEILDLATGAVTALPEESATEPAWSPQGSKIAFVFEGYLAVANLDGSGLQEIGDGNDADPAWAPDGHTLAYAQDGQIWTVDASGNGARQLTAGTQDGSPSWQTLGPPPAGCTLWGTKGNDVLVGTNGNDTICGLNGDDHLIGLGGRDALEGDAGNDRLAGGSGSDDFLEGDAGNDVLDLRDGQSDVADGGPGKDTAIVDGRIDQTFATERVVVDKDLAAWHPATASGAEAGAPATAAFDGDPATAWSTDGQSPAWVQVDLGQREQLGSVRLVTAGSIAQPGPLVLGASTAGGPFRLLHAFRGPTVDDEELAFAPRGPWRNIRYLRVVVLNPSSDGTTSIRELAAYGPRATKR